MIESGSHVPGVDAAAFGVPPHTALRIELPSPALAPFLADYHVLDSEGPHAQGAETWMLPAWRAIRLILTDRPITLRLGRRLYDPLPVASLYGTTSRAMKMTTHGGVTVGVGVKPLGWARFFKRRADLFRDQVVPLGADDETHDLATASERIGVPEAALRRVSARYFGFPPKTLLIRTRLIHSLLRMMAQGGDPDYRLMAPTYFDASHFLRDADRFLGMTPRRFAKLDNPYLKAVLRARAAVARAARAEALTRR